MRLKNILLLLAAVSLAAACTKAELEGEVADEPDPATTEEAESCYELGVANIYLSEALADAVETDLASGGIVTRASSEGLNDLYSSLGIASVRRLFPDAGEFEPRTRREGLHRWYKVTYDPSVTATRAASDFSAVDGVEIAEPVRKTKPMSFNDPYFYYQWHFYNDGGTVLGSGFVKGCDINVTPVWESYTTGSSDVIVAVVDGGIDYTHPDLAANYVGGYNFVYNMETVTADDHGTHVAGTIAAVNNNRIGLCGIAGGDYANGVAGCGLLSCQMFSGDYSGDSSSAIKYGADNGAVISQNSWGYVYSTEAQAAAGNIGSADKAAVDYFIKYAGCDNDGNQLPGSPMKGGVVVFAAGNDAWGHGWPAEYEEIVAVGAIGPDFTAAYYTTYGDWVDICAPGGSDLESYPYGMVCSTFPESQYGWTEGTSMACPHVSGVAALIASYYGGQGFTADDLKEKLIGGANRSVISSNYQIGPLVDALGSITYGTTIPPDKVTSFTTDVLSNRIDFTWNVTADEDNFKAYGYVLMAATDRDLLAGTDPSDIPSGVSYGSVLVGDIAVGEEITGFIDGLQFSTDYYVAISGYDYARNYSELSDIKAVSTGPNNPPMISTSYTGDYTIGTVGSLEVPFTVTEPDGHGFTVSFTSGSSADSLEQTSEDGSSYILTITAILVDEGTYTATITATDSYGAASTLDITYTILENQAPVVVKQADGIFLTSLGTWTTIDLTEHITDPDGETLSWSVTNSNSSAVSTDIVDGSMTVMSRQYGTSEITVTGTDTRGKTASMTFGVMVSDGPAQPKAYPNPVSDTLYISTGEEMSTDITMYTSTGAKVYETTETVSAFKPATIDVSGFAPGRYTVKVSYGGKDYDLNVTKI